MASNSPRPCEPSREISVRNVPRPTHQDLKNIAAHHGLPMMQVVGKKLTEIIDGYPEHMKESRPCEYYGRLAIHGLPAKTKEHAKNIAANLGISLSEFLKPLLSQIALSYPEHMRRPLLD